MKLFADFEDSIIAAAKAADAGNDALAAENVVAALHHGIGILAHACNDIHRIADALEQMAKAQTLMANPLMITTGWTGQYQRLTSVAVRTDQKPETMEN